MGHDRQPLDARQDNPVGASAATIRALELVRQQGECIDATETARIVKCARQWSQEARQAQGTEDGALELLYYRDATGPLTIDFFLDTSAATGDRPDEEYVEFLDHLGPFRAQLPPHVRCRLWSIAHLRARDLVYLAMLGLRSRDKTLLIPISHGIPDARFHSHAGTMQRLGNPSLRQLFRFQGSHMRGIPRNDVCEGSCYHVDRVRDWAILTKGKVFHTTTSDYLLTAHLFDLAKHWAANAGAVARPFSLFSRAAVPPWYPKNPDGTARSEPFDVVWTASDGTWDRARPRAVRADPEPGDG